MKVRGRTTDRAGRAQARAALIDAACAWGWDRPSSANAALAETLLAGASELAQSDFVTACITGEIEAVRRMLDEDPELVRRKLAPRDWDALLYVSYCVLLRQPGLRADRILEVAKLLLERGADPNSHYTSECDGPSRFPALYAAIAISANLELARLLLEGGADPNDSQSLYHAAERWDTDALDLLHAYGLNPKDVSYCLLHKIDFQQEPGIRWFLHHGADPNARHPHSDESALHWAIKRACKSSVVELLLERGADPNARTRAGHTVYPAILAWTPLDLSERLGRSDISELLRGRGAQQSPTTEKDEFVLACARGDAASARSRLREDPELIKRLAVEDRFLITHLAQQNNRAGVALMLEVGFDPNVRGWMNATPLHWAACLGNPELVRRLLAHGAALSDVGGYFRTPVHTCLYCHWNRDGDYVGVMTELVRAGAELPSESEPTGDTDLDAAVVRLRQRQQP